MSGLNGFRKLFTANEQRIYKTVYERNPISRVKVAERLSLTRAAVTIGATRLIENGFIEEIGKGDSDGRRGRREVLLAVKPNAIYVIAIHIGLHYIQYGILNIAGETVASKTIRHNHQISAHDTLSGIADELIAMIEKQNIPQEKIFGLGAAIPGVVNYEAGTAQLQSLLHWHQFPVKTFLQERLEIPIFIENDVKALTLAEFYLGVGRNVRNLVCLWFRDGIGAGIVYQGRLLRGHTGSAGEIGFNRVSLTTPVHKNLLIDGDAQCIGDILSIANLRRTTARALADGWDSMLAPTDNIDAFIRAVRQDDPLAVHISGLVTEFLGSVCIDLIYSFNPELLILSGPLFYNLPSLVDDVRQVLKQGMLNPPIEAVVLKNGVIDDRSVLIGGTGILLDQLFMAPTEEK